METYFSPTQGNRLNFRKLAQSASFTALLIGAPTFAEEITVGWGNTAQVHPLELQEESQTQIYSTTPHRKLNPDHIESSFEGYIVSQLADPSVDYEKVYVFGDDGYMSMIPADVIRDSKVIIATTKDGKPLKRRDGGRQIVYPTRVSETVPQPIQVKAAFWTWYNAAVIFGNFDNKLATNGALLDLSNTAGNQYSDYKRPSVFSYDPIKCPNTLLAPLTAVEHNWPSRLIARQFSGQSFEVSPSQSELIFAPGKTAIPVECGGPYIVKQGETMYFNVYALDTNNS